MLTSVLRDKLIKRLIRYENIIPYMYLDSKGYVTVGIGHKLATVADAEKLHFVEDKTDKKATPAEIKTDYDNVKKQKKGHYAIHYKKYTTLKLKHDVIISLVNKDIDSFYADLKRIYPQIDSYPEQVQLALFDLIFNLGSTKLKTGWPLFNKAIKAHNWKAAGTESHRKLPISAERNKYVKDLFDTAPPFHPASHTKPSIIRP